MGDDAQVLFGPATIIIVSDEEIVEGRDDAAKCG